MSIIIILIKNGFVEYEHNNYTYDDKYFYLDVV